MRPTVAEIDLGAIRHNVAAFARLVEPARLCVVVKADGYGHGDVPVAGAAQEAGADWLAVALVEEGVRLREGGIDGPILVLSEPDPESFHELARWSLTPTVYSMRGVEGLVAAGSSHRVHVKIDTGMHRVGVAPRLLHDLIGSIEASKLLEIEALWTHFSVADEDPDFTKRQTQAFLDAISPYRPSLVHMANTAGAVLFPEARADMCRVGLGTYGLHPCPETHSRIELRPAMRVLSRVSHLQRLEAGSRPSYGRIRPLAEEATVATVPIGYADGLPRLLSREGRVLIGGRRFPLAGMVTMDQVVVDVGDADVAVGDEVVLLGTQDNETIPAEEWADLIGTISYEVVCGIGPRVPRRYLQ